MFTLRHQLKIEANNSRSVVKELFKNKRYNDTISNMFKMSNIYDMKEQTRETYGRNNKYSGQKLVYS